MLYPYSGTLSYNKSVSNSGHKFSIFLIFQMTIRLSYFKQTQAQYTILFESKLDSGHSLLFKDLTKKLLKTIPTTMYCKCKAPNCSVRSKYPFISMPPGSYMFSWSICVTKNHKTFSKIMFSLFIICMFTSFSMLCIGFYRFIMNTSYIIIKHDYTIYILFICIDACGINARFYFIFTEKKK